MWMEPKVFVARGKRDPPESSGLSHSILCDDCFSSAHLSLFGNRRDDELFLVGQKSQRKERN